ncbi:MAG: tetratricopeptide repeat protein [Alcanivoracaceae bacterium]
MGRSVVFSALLLAGGLMYYQPVQAADADSCRPAQQHSSHPHSREILQMLTRADTTGRREQLERFLANPPDSRLSVDRVALNRARLTLAAEYLSASRFAEARQLLSTIELDSPIAVQASLLLAESFRLEGDPVRASQWLLRTGQRYGADPEALASMLEQATELRLQGNPHQAFALYNMVQSQILDNAEQVGAMRAEANILIERLLRTRLDESRAAQSQMLKQMIQDTDSTLIMELGALARAAAERRCLERQQRQLSDLAFDNSAQQARIRPFLVMLEREEGMLSRRLEQLQPSPQDNDEEVAELQKQLEAARNQRQTLLVQQQQLPDEAGRRHRELAEQIARLDQDNQTRRERIQQELSQLSAVLMARYRELAAESQYGRATLLDEHKRGG